MYDELVKVLRETDFSYGCPCGAEPLCKDKDCVILQAADAIEELQGRAKVLEKVADKWCETVPKWIPVTERLPSENDRYLTVSIEPWFGTTVVDTMRWSGVWMLDGRQTEATVTHWMPLPEPPKGERKDDE